MTYDPEQPPSDEPRDPNQGNRQRSRGTPGEQSAQRSSGPENGSYATGREEEPYHPSPVPLIAAGVVGFLLLGGLIGGLVTAFGGNGTTPAASPTHHPATAPATHAPVAHSSAPATSSLAATGHLLNQFQNIGSSQSSAFAVPAAVTSRYIYRCPTRPGAFDAQMVSANGSDSQTIAKTGGAGGTSSVALHPKFPGSMYHIVANTKCEYRIQVYGK